jgi:hypothetical protein
VSACELDEVRAFGGDGFVGADRPDQVLGGADASQEPRLGFAAKPVAPVGGREARR